MHLDIHFDRDEITRLVEAMAPLRIQLDDEEKARWVELDRPRSIEMVPGRGVRFTCSGEVRYDLGPVVSRLRLEALTAVLAPRVVRDGDATHALSCWIEVEAIDFARIPKGIDAAIVSRANRMLAPRSTHLVWAFERALRAEIPFPVRVPTLDVLRVETHAPELRIDEHGLHARLEVDLEIEHQGDDDGVMGVTTPGGAVSAERRS